MVSLNPDPLFKNESQSKNLHPLWGDTPGYRPIRPLLGNELLLGVLLVILLFLSQIPWLALWKMIPILPSLKSDHLMYFCLGLIIVWRFISQVSHERVGSLQLGGYSSPKAASWALYDIVGEMILTVGLCILVALKNPLAILVVFGFLLFKCTTGFPYVDQAKDYFPEDP